MPTIDYLSKNSLIFVEMKVLHDFEHVSGPNIKSPNQTEKFNSYCIKTCKYSKPSKSIIYIKIKTTKINKWGDYSHLTSYYLNSQKKTEEKYTFVLIIKNFLDIILTSIPDDFLCIHNAIYKNGILFPQSQTRIIPQ